MNTQGIMIELEKLNPGVKGYVIQDLMDTMFLRFPGRDYMYKLEKKPVGIALSVLIDDDTLALGYFPNPSAPEIIERAMGFSPAPVESGVVSFEEFRKQNKILRV